MALRAASSVMTYVGPGDCCHKRPTTKKGTGKAVKHELSTDFVLTCAVCEPTLADNELWGPADQPAPLTTDEERQLKAQQTDANRSMLEGIASIPGMVDVLRQLVEGAKAK